MLGERNPLCVLRKRSATKMTALRDGMFECYVSFRET